MNEQFTFFWGGPFSNFSRCQFTVDGVDYNCSEQYYMARKAGMFRDLTMLKKIMATDNPYEQKRCGRQVHHFDAQVWHTVCRDVMFRANMAKYSQNPNLHRLLLNTKDTTLVEASPKDKLWGIGLDASDPRAKDRTQWKGQNWLGEILMEVRQCLV